MKQKSSVDTRVENNKTNKDTGVGGEMKGGYGETKTISTKHMVWGG